MKGRSLAYHLLAFALLAPASMALSETARFVYRFDDTSMTMPVRGAGDFENFSFGLTQAQKEDLYRLSEGKVDFRNLFYKDATDATSGLTQIDGYQGMIHKDVPPPYYTEEVSDPELDGQWWIEDLGVKDAWTDATGAGVTIADCDAGYHTEESDLNDNLLLEKRYDLADEDNPRKVSDGNFVYHGTAVAAIMAGVQDGEGTNGIAFEAKVVPLQNFNYDGSLDDLDKEEATAKCVLRAVEDDSVDIIVLENQTTNGSSETFAGTREAVTLALESGVTIVSAAGNYSKELTIEEENDTGSIIVGALSQDGTKAGFSNYGSRISVAAFGEKLHTLYGPDGKFGEFGGTSGATPQVAATVALMLELNPDLTPSQIKKILVETRLESEDTSTVGGQLDVAAAVEKAQSVKGDAEERARMENFRAEAVEILRR